MDHDQIFKELLETFFAEFLSLFFPDKVRLLDLSDVTFINKEIFTDLLKGSRRSLDVLAEVRTKRGRAETVLIHIEVEARRSAGMKKRMSEYYSALKLRRGKPVYPVVVYLSPGAGGLTTETYVAEVLGDEIERFNYRVVDLPDLSAEDWRVETNPLSAALRALMKPGPEGRVIEKALSLRQVAMSDLDDARQIILSNTIEQYLPLNAAEEEEFVQALGRSGAEEVPKMLSVYEVRTKRKVLLRQMERKFGEIPDTVAKAIEQLSPEDLDRMLDRFVEARSIEDMSLS